MSYPGKTDQQITADQHNEKALRENAEPIETNDEEAARRLAIMPAAVVMQIKSVKQGHDGCIRLAVDSTANTHDGDVVRIGGVPQSAFPLLRHVPARAVASGESIAWVPIEDKVVVIDAHHVDLPDVGFTMAHPEGGTATNLTYGEKRKEYTDKIAKDRADAQAKAAAEEKAKQEKAEADRPKAA